MQKGYTSHGGGQQVPAAASWRWPPGREPKGEIGSAGKPLQIKGLCRRYLWTGQRLEVRRQPNGAAGTVKRLGGLGTKGTTCLWFKGAEGQNTKSKETQKIEKA